MDFRSEAQLRAYRMGDGRRILFDGTGAMLYGGRWNTPGRRVVYAAETWSGALLENLVHANTGRVPKHHAWIEITVPAGIEVEHCNPDAVPGWDLPDLAASRAFGDAWYDSRRSAVLLVPSVVARVERNVLIHQEHPDFGRIRAGEPVPVEWDARLLRQG